nr:GRAM domain-containing protein 2 isoform X2 [Pogona vitticeps]
MANTFDSVACCVKPMLEKACPMPALDKLEALPKEKSAEAPNGSLRLSEATKNKPLKKCPQEVTAPNKYNLQYHKLFKDIPTEESVLKVCSCALQRDILIQGRLYISPNWLCFYANLFGKDIKVVIPVVSVQLIKKHKTARLLPNGLAITTNASRKYIFVSLISRDSVYDVLRRVCTHLQVSSKKSLSLRELTEEPGAVSLVRPGFCTEAAPPRTVGGSPLPVGGGCWRGAPKPPPKHWGRPLVAKATLHQHHGS